MVWKAILYIIKISFVAHWRKLHISQLLIYQWLLLLTCFLFLSLSLSPSHRGFPASVRTTCVLVYLEWSPGWEQTVGFVCGTINQLSFNKNRKPDERQREESWGVGSYLGRKKDRGWGEKVERRVREKGVWPRSWTLINQTATITSKVFMWLDWLIRHFQARGGWGGVFSSSSSSSVPSVLWETAEWIVESFYVVVNAAMFQSGGLQWGLMWGFQLDPSSPARVLWVCSKLQRPITFKILLRWYTNDTSYLHSKPQEMK